MSNRWIAPAIIAAVTIITFLPALYAASFFDDAQNLADNPQFRAFGFDYLPWAFTTFYNGHYRPLLWLSLGLDYVLWGGLDSFGFHLTNLFIHAANAVLFFFVAQRLIVLALPEAAEGESWRLTVASAFAAMFFSLHPLQTEVLAQITGRKESLATFFFLWVVWFYLQGRIRPAAIFYLLSLLSKSAGGAVAAPLALFILDKYPLRRKTLELKNKIPFVLLSGSFAVVALLVKNDAGQVVVSLDAYPFMERFLQALYMPGFSFG